MNVKFRIPVSNKRIDVEIKYELIEGEYFWQVHVLDYGVGIEPERKDLLFTRFMESANGTGLGLWVVKALTESFGGRVDVNDRIQGDYSKGSVFIITLPTFSKDKSVPD